MKIYIRRFKCTFSNCISLISRKWGSIFGEIKKIMEIMLQRVAIQYLRGYEGKPMSKFVKKGSDEYIKYKEGESDRKNGLPNRYIKSTE